MELTPGTDRMFPHRKYLKRGKPGSEVGFFLFHIPGALLGPHSCRNDGSSTTGLAGAQWSVVTEELVDTQSWWGLCDGCHYQLDWIKKGLMRTGEMIWLVKCLSLDAVVV